jgi:ATP-dependent helicase/nuclease subunit B
VDDVLRLFAEPDGMISRRRLSDALPLPEETARREDLRIRALLDLATPGREAAAAALHDRLVADGDARYARAVRRGAWFLRPREARLADTSGLPPRRRHSASALEDFAQCPFRHFAGRTLRLERPRAADEADPLVLGEIAHEVLARLFEPTRDGGPMPDPDAVGPLVEEGFARWGPLVREGLATGRVREEMIRSLRALVLREGRRLAAGPWRPAHLEESFGRGDRELTVPGEGGEPVRLTGRVDRIDTDGEGGGVIIDYKYSRHGFAGERKRAVEEGAYFQLPVYLLALRDAWGLEPRGAWLYPVREPETSGYTLPGGPPADRPVELDAEGLADLLDRTAAFIADYDSRIRAGEIRIRPRDTRACGRCDFADLCRFEAWMAEGTTEEPAGGDAS